MSEEVVNLAKLKTINIVPKGEGPLKKLTPGLSVPFLKSTGLLLWSIAGKLSYPFAYKPNINLFPFRHQVLAFFLAIDAYIESGENLIPAEEIIKNCFLIGPEYSKTLKNLRYYSFMKTIGGVPEEPSPESEEAYLTFDREIGSVFNYRYLFNWKEETNDFEEYAFLPLEVIEVPDLKEFFINNLPEECEIFDREEVLFRSSSSKTLYHQRSRYNFEICDKNKLDSFSTEMRPSKLTKIQKTAGDPREIVTLELEDLNTVLWMEGQVKNIINSYKENMMVSKRDVFEQKLTRASVKPGAIYYCRDIKKEGWTKPRFLLKLLIQSINEKYNLQLPDEFYQTIQVIHNQQIMKPVRGHGLGMANALTTLLYILLFRYCCYSGSSLFEDSSVLELKALVLNDDFMAYGSEDMLEEYKSREDVLFKALGLILNKKKSYTSPRGFSFAEYYCHNEIFLGKNSYERFWAYLPLLGVNIRHAKVIAMALEPNKQCIQVYKEWFGYEFFPEEYKYSATLGGWYTPKMVGVDISLAKLDIHSYFPILSKVCLALDQVSPPLHKVPGLWDLKVDKFIIPEFLQNMELSQEQLEFMGYRTTRKILKNFIRVGAEAKHWEIVSSATQRLYRKVSSLSYSDFIKYYLQNHVNAIPPMNEFVEETRLEGLSFTPPEYPFSTPYLDYTAYIGRPIAGKGKNKTPFGLARDVDSRSRLFSSVFRSRIAFFNETMSSIEMEGRLPDWFLSSYRDPVHVGAIMKGYSDKLPYVPFLIGKFPENIVIQEVLQRYPITRNCFPIFNVLWQYGRFITEEEYQAFLLSMYEDLCPDTETEEVEPPLVEDNLTIQELFPGAIEREIPKDDPIIHQPTLENSERFMFLNTETVQTAPAEVRALFYENHGSSHGFYKALGIPSSIYADLPDVPLVPVLQEEPEDEHAEEEDLDGNAWDFLEGL